HQARLRPGRVRRLHRPDRGCALLRLLHALAHGAGSEGGHARRTGKRGRNAPPRAASHHRRTRLPVRLLHVGLHHVDRRIPEDESESEPLRAGAGHLGEPLPLPGLRQDPHLDDARRRVDEEGLTVPSEPKNVGYGVNSKLIGKDYSTPDLYAKVTGTAKYAEDFRAEGMLFCKLLLSPMPHARVTKIDASAALAMPGVKGILTEDDFPKVQAGEELGENLRESAISEGGLRKQTM